MIVEESVKGREYDFDVGERVCCRAYLALLDSDHDGRRWSLAPRKGESFPCSYDDTMPWSSEESVQSHRDYLGGGCRPSVLMGVCTCTALRL